MLYSVKTGAPEAECLGKESESIEKLTETLFGGLGLFSEFTDNKKNIEQQQAYCFMQYPSINTMLYDILFITIVKLLSLSRKTLTQCDLFLCCVQRKSRKRMCMLAMVLSLVLIILIIIIWQAIK